MKELCLVSDEERKNFFEVAAYESQKPFEVIEKDYWVVWTLARLFDLPDLKSHLTFKGGTSLSKIYGLIDRFSEDVDVSIERKILGFDENNKPENLSSKSKQKSVLEELSQACSKFIQEKMLPNLKNAITLKLETNKGWQLICDPDDPQTLLFYYQSISQNEYIRPFVKIEMGARAEHWPANEHSIESYAKSTLQEKIYEPKVFIRVLAAERTFWEKATILHQYAHLPENKLLPPRLSRHFYDFFKLLNSEIKIKAIQTIELLEHVANHKQIYFASGWANYESARKGSLKLIPADRIIEGLEKDYKLMEPMFFSKIPDWKLVLKTIQEFEAEFNEKK